MTSTLGRAGLRPALIGLAALAVGFSVEWPKRLNGSAESDATALERGAFISVPKRSFALASLAPSLPPSDAGVARDSARDAGEQRSSSFAERFAAVFWFNGDDEEPGAVRIEAARSAADDEVDVSPQPPRVNDGRRTAVYVITERVVYMPNGTRLEAHSGLGSRADDPRYVNVRNRGPTPPNVYDLVMRERRFHGIRAIRLIPVDESRMFGRDGILAHKYMRGGKAQSAGCVVFRDYPAFLNAFLRGEVDRLVVVERIEDAPETPRSIGHANLSHHAKRKRVASR
jgi:Protein of unknown function (DUF2778)